MTFRSWEWELPKTWSRIGQISLLVIIPTVIIVGFLWIPTVRQNMDLFEFEPEVYLVKDADELTDSTQTYCYGIPHCVQAVESESVRIVRFDDHEALVAEADRIGPDAFVSDWFVVEFLSDQLTEDQRSFVTTEVDGPQSAD